MWPTKASATLELKNAVESLLNSLDSLYKVTQCSNQTPLIRQEESTVYAPSYDMINNNNQTSWNFSSENSPSFANSIMSYSTPPTQCSTQTLLMRQEESTVYTPSYDMNSNNNMYENNNLTSWNFSSENSSSVTNSTPTSHSGGYQDSVSSPTNVQKASKFPEKRFSEFISPNVDINEVEKILRDAHFGLNPWKFDSYTTYTKDDFDFDFGYSAEIQPQGEVATEPSFKPSRSSTPVDTPENTLKYIDQFQYPQTYDQNSEYYYSNCQSEENERWGSPIARRPLQQYNYQYDQPIVPRVIKNRVTTTTKKVKQMVDYCVFCFNNKEVEAVYVSHTVRDTKGRCLCPTLRKYVCPICHKDGDEAHTMKYCKEKKILTEEDMRNPRRRYL